MTTTFFIPYIVRHSRKTDTTIRLDTIAQSDLTALEVMNKALVKDKANGYCSDGYVLEYEHDSLNGITVATGKDDPADTSVMLYFPENGLTRIVLRTQQGYVLEA